MTEAALALLLLTDCLSHSQVKESRSELADARELAAGDAAKIISLTAHSKLLQSKLDALQAEVLVLPSTNASLDREYALGRFWLSTL